ncbi:copper resistance D family protein [Cupriavidus sp. CuC1]|uniref:copper resistance D family protein n=1 Tax=Cupriavidus sp. CuC1 TaxID=3373131 RepID=UPI0037D7B0FF
MDHTMMATNVGSMVVTAADLLALTTCIGVLGFRIWVVSFKDGTSYPSPDFLMPLWWTLGICLAVLTLSSIGELLRRALEMSGRPIGELALALPAVLSKTHFGRVWLLRPVALVVLWLGWRRRRGLDSPGVAAAMLAAACLIATSRSLSGHAADWGDITLPELMDWMHLLAVSLWGGSLIALTVTGFHTLTERADERRQVVAAMVSRWSALAGAALAVVILTGMYNAWLEVQRVEALLTTAYGRLLLVKLSLVAIIVTLGAANRYLCIPSLHAWATGATSIDKPSGLLATILSVLTLEWSRQGAHLPLKRFVRSAMLEGILIIGTIICVAVLVSQMPARHVNRMPAGHPTHSSGVAH